MPFPTQLTVHQQGIYRIEREAAEPDPHIIDLNTEIGNSDASLTSSLPEVPRKYVSTFGAVKYMHLTSPQIRVRRHGASHATPPDLERAIRPVGERARYQEDDAEHACAAAEHQNDHGR